MYIEDVNLCSLDDRQLTRLRRDRVGFVFQSFNLVPTLTAAENVVLPLRLAGRAPDRSWMERVIDAVRLADSTRRKGRPSRPFCQQWHRGS
ncbi:hypothetical protein [Allorhizocola rhizosphaerae]|uniref:hypothetical protein n=1 Tax=Allorhizocola rhizosphaerae TaxID=1872709 RepID=UPI003CCC648A